MEIRELKKMLRNSTAVLVIEDNSPSFVVMNYDMYLKMTGEEETQTEIASISQHLNSRDLNGREMKPSPGELELIEKINKDILALKEEIENEEKTLTDTSID